MFKTQKDFTYLMPAHFGGGKFDPEAKLTQKSTALLIRYETDQKLLENYIPEGFELSAPEIQVAFNKFTEINWMQGGHYNLIDVSAPVRFNGKNEQLDGNYSLVVWENNTAPILGGREQTGIPKIFADIEDLHVLKPHYATTASYAGNTFLNMNFEATGELTGDEFEQAKAQSSSLNTIGWRYIPKIGAPGAELSQFILYPQGMEMETAQIGNARLKWTEMTPMQNPVQFHIINSLAALPIKRIINALFSEGSATLRAFGARILK
ncbi:MULTISPECIES: acetoacetate decarboxylase family protein [Methanobacterium]|uniref:Acetoacetate decarboxylase n=1 Tax=Methanobacterium bryantii TaxID=2161 RepID=A0A2A2H5B7_METBR|nr:MULTISPECIES: acetoacetate decarboxylase family protein [Methanobacterium]OEC88315.1 acetoacetate decarboxylase [Methanobacterium sp. A39]PAV04504.1 acetoacetate decarboxylase [Methanobacterium bryantii]